MVNLWSRMRSKQHMIVYVLENLINKNYSIGYIKVKLGQKFNVLSFDKKK